MCFDNNGACLMGTVIGVVVIQIMLYFIVTWAMDEKYFHSLSLKKVQNRTIVVEASKLDAFREYYGSQIEANNVTVVTSAKAWKIKLGDEELRILLLSGI